MDTHCVISLQAAFPPATKKSPAAKEAAVKEAMQRGLSRQEAEQQINSSIQLFPDGELAEIKKPYTKFDTFMRQRTIGWMATGQQLCHIKNVDIIETAFADAQLVMLPMIDKFVENYAATLDRLERRGGYFNRADYPGIESIRERFRFELTFYPIQDPEAFNIGGLTTEQVDRLKRRLAESIEQAATEATENYARKMLAEMRNLAARTSGADNTRFSADSWSRKLEAFCNSGLNVTNAPELTEAVETMKAAAVEVENYQNAGGLESAKELHKAETHRLADRAARKLAAFL
jgi:hypothetical protein